MKFMTRNEVVYRLYKGENIFDLSIEKWDRISLSPIEAKKYHVHSSKTCALCITYNCEDCPLDKAGYGCHLSHSPWDNFNRNPSYINAKQIILAIEDSRINKIKKETYNVYDILKLIIVLIIIYMFMNLMGLL